VAAEAGARVLLVSTDPAHSLGHVFEQRFTALPRRVRVAKPRVAGRSARRTAVPGTLDVVELDADRALDRWIGERRVALKQIVGRGTYLDDDDIDSLLRLAFPGVDELIGLLELTRLAEAGQYPEVVVDTAPTGHTLRLLGMPASLRRIAGILEQMQAKHRYLSESLAGRYRSDGSDLAIGEIEARGLALEALLRDPRQCTFHWITLPEVVAMEEAQDGMSALAASGIAVKELVVNRLATRPRGGCPVCEARVACEEPIIARAHALFPGIPVRLLPTLSDEPRGPVLLRQVGHCLRRAGRVLPQRPPARRSRHRAILPASDVRGGDDWLSVMAPPGVRLLLFAGKGGVGKTTCAASVALSLAGRAPDRSVLLLSTDPAHSLGDVLATPLDDVARPVPGGPPGLRARELDAGALFANRRRRYLDAVDRVFAELRGGSRFDLAFDRAVVEDLVDLAPPGIDELLGLLAITDVLMPGSSSDAQSMVIVDTAPTGHVLRLLAMPATGLEWVHALMGLLLKYRKVIGLGQLGTDLVDISRELRQLQALLTDRRRARLVVVTRAAELSRLETRRLVTGVNALNIGISATVVNALTPAACGRCLRIHNREQRTVATLRKDLRRLVAPPCAIIGAPIVVPPPRGAEALRQWQRAWTTLDA
jgi:arsenite-transporting ATPase